ncbi:carbonic anhydrase [Glutamicibacter halophytocola]|uniref:carbonic anhydrase n=1 Tax=Glutamicibacter halophytocola TaxID=1933880 RepID=UPI00321B10B4
MPQPIDSVVNATITSRRKLLAGATGLLALAGLSACASEKSPQATTVGHAATPKTPDGVLKALTEGNQRFTSGQVQHPNQDSQRRGEQAGHQSPFALVHGRVDSRVAPEMLFDQGIGDLFVTRTAGAVLDDTLVGSMEFAVSSPLLGPAAGHPRPQCVRCGDRHAQGHGSQPPGPAAARRNGGFCGSNRARGPEPESFRIRRPRR